MCWNSKVSLNTFLFSLFGISFAYFNNVIEIFEYLYFLSFISMQLLEYFTWNNLNDKKMNTFLSQIGLFLIFLQPIFFAISCKKVENKLKMTIIAFYLMFSLFCILYFPIDFSMNKAENGHLAWNWLSFPTIIILLWLSFTFGLYLYQKQYLKFGVYLIIVLAIYYTYYKTNTWGSLWCWIANLLAVNLIFQVFFGFNLSNCLIDMKKV
jgi:hypothetical protein